MLAVVGIIAVLIGLLTPGLSSARRQGFRTKSLSDARTIGQHLSLYAGQYNDAYPYNAPLRPVQIEPPDFGSSATLSYSNYWQFSTLWPCVMHWVAPWEEHYRVWISPRSRRETAHPWTSVDPTIPIGPSYVLLPACYARPETWSRTPPPPSPALLRPVAHADVLHPSGKAVMFDAETAYEPAGVNSDATVVLFGDAHSAAQKKSRARAPGTNIFTGFSVPLWDTLDGARGIDY
jgi:hypothetical protein